MDARHAVGIDSHTTMVNGLSVLDGSVNRSGSRMFGSLPMLLPEGSAEVDR
jgi:hypothetical protein